EVDAVRLEPAATAAGLVPVQDGAVGAPHVEDPDRAGRSLYPGQDLGQTALVYALLQPRSERGHAPPPSRRLGVKVVGVVGGGVDRVGLGHIRAGVEAHG